ncbi:MAG TPA: phosphoribosyltransferase family protein [Bacteroidales bacterium]|nr:phosphoribosyltransferase family protein [Bacteroidales bacterium]HNS45790.1 phosphoribosyltransferase family protein [Bacteroidales bacterium]
MKTIKVKDKEFSPFIPEAKIQRAVKLISRQINRDMTGKVPLFLVILNGAFIFASDLLRRINLDCDITFVKLASYEGTTTTSTVRELIGLGEVVKDRTIIIVEDIVDTGITIEHVIQMLKKMEAADVRVAAMFFKPDAFRKDFRIDYKGMDIPPDFVVGYGLDYDGFGRNHPALYRLIRTE